MNLNFSRDRLTALAGQMQKGDAHAAELIYNELVHKTFGFYLSRTSRREVAEDLTQDVFLKLVDKINLFDEKKGMFEAWFWNVARNTLIDYYRAKKEKSFVDLPEQELESIEAPHDSRFEHRNLMTFVKSLSQDEKELFELRYIADMPYSEIAKMLNKSEGSLRVATNRLKQKIKDAFQ